MRKNFEKVRESFFETNRLHIGLKFGVTMPILHLLSGLTGAPEARRAPAARGENDQTPETQANLWKFAAALKNFAQTCKDREFPQTPKKFWDS